MRTTQDFLVLAVTALAAIALGLAFLTFLEDRVIEEEQLQRYHSYVLADELRQSSDELSRMVRTYAATSDERYIEYYQEILDIRNGVAPRPEEYHIIYWDFVVATGQPPRESGEPKALRTLMKEAGFTDEEFALLDEAEAESNDLVNLETEAINAMQGLFKDASGNYTVQGTPDPELARSLLYGEDYHKAKERIMRPIERFFVAIENRIAAETALVREQRRLVRFALLASTVLAAGLGALSVFMRVRSRRGMI